MMVPIDSDSIDYTISSTIRVLGSQNIEVTSTLTVHNTAMNDSGVYTCEAMNSLGSVNDTAELIVQCKYLIVKIVKMIYVVATSPFFPPSVSAVAPTFTQVVVPTNVTFPDNLTLTCTATAIPRPNITWYKDGAELMEGVQVSITSKEEGDRVLESTLTVTSPFLDGIGSYTCTAENVVGTANSTAEVTVYCELLPGIVVNEKDLYSTFHFVTHTYFSYSVSCAVSCDIR